MDSEALKEEIRRAYGEGSVIDDEEFHEGNVCVVVPARNYRG